MNSKLVTVYTTRKQTLIAVARSLLDDNEIEYSIKGDPLQDTFSYAETEFIVREEDAEHARVILKDLI